MRIDSASISRGWAKRRAGLDAGFWSKVDQSGDCWLWGGARQSRNRYGTGGYGTLIRHGRQVYAHRHAYELAVGPIPDGMEILHQCDNPPCVNPAHLRVGTHAENMAEVRERGRSRPAIGERSGSARLTEAAVREIRRVYGHDGASAKDLAQRFGVHRESIYAVVLGKSWRHVA